MNNVYITYLTGDQLSLNPGQIEDLKEYLDRVKVNLPQIVVRPADRLCLALEVYFQRDPSLPISDSQLYRVLRQRIEDYFAVQRGSIGRGIQHSEVVKFLQDQRFEFNNIVYPMTDFVKVNITAICPLVLPVDQYDATITLDSGYTPVTGDVWDLVVDGVTYSVTVQAGDSLSDIVDRMSLEIFSDTFLILTNPAPNQIRLRHPEDEGTFTVSVGSGNLSAQTSVNQWKQLPRPTNVIDSSVDQILPGTFQIAEVVENLGVEELEILYQDDGNGTLVDQTGLYTDVQISYTDSRIEVPPLPAGQYDMIYRQNRFQNYSVTDQAWLTNRPFRASIDPVNQYFFSRIELL